MGEQTTPPQRQGQAVAACCLEVLVFLTSDVVNELAVFSVCQGLRVHALL